MKHCTLFKMKNSGDKILEKITLPRLSMFVVALGLTNFSFGQTVTTTLATGTTISPYNPILGNFVYSYCQQIYLATDFNVAVQGQPNRITKIRFRYYLGSFSNSNDWTIYMGSTTKNQFTSTTDWIPLASMQQVFAGILTVPDPLVTDAWVEITLTTPFQWNGVSNVVVAVDENKFGSSDVLWRAQSSGPNRSIYFGTIASATGYINPDPAAPPVARGRNPYVPQAQLVHVKGSPLPVSLTDFNVQIAEKRKVEISWATHSESNNDYFTIERSSDAEHFRAIGEPIDGAGNSSNLLQYAVHDLDPMPGVNYYRLKQTDFNGEYTYSEIRSVSFAENQDAVKLFPNPASNGSALQIKTAEATEVFVQISASNGEIVETITQHLEAGTNTVYLGEFLKAGVYNVSVRDQQFLNENLKLVIVQ